MVFGLENHRYQWFYDGFWLRQHLCRNRSSTEEIARLKSALETPKMCIGVLHPRRVETGARSPRKPFHSTHLPPPPHQTFLTGGCFFRTKSAQSSNSGPDIPNTSRQLRGGTTSGQTLKTQEPHEGRDNTSRNRFRTKCDLTSIYWYVYNGKFLTTQGWYTTIWWTLTIGWTQMPDWVKTRNIAHPVRLHAVILHVLEWEQDDDQHHLSII